MIRPGSTYANLREELESTVEGADLWFLACVYGPRPYWELPDREKDVPIDLRVLYILDRSEAFVIATVRKPEHDSPIFIRKSTFMNSVNI